VTVNAGLVGAVAAPLCYGSASVLQAVGSRRVAGGPDLDPRLFARLARQLPYVVGLGLDLLGFAASLFALRTLPLFLVQAAIAGSVGVTALLARRFLAARLRPMEGLALVALAAGLVLLAVSAREGHANAVSRHWRWIVLAGAVALPIPAAAAARVPGPRGAALLAAAAGLAFGGVGVAARVLRVPHPLWRLVTEPTAYALAGYGALGLLLFATALQRGSVTMVSAVMFTVETAVPAGLGLAWLGDGVRAGFVGAAVLGFVLALGGALQLARHGEPPR
jgi:hypothetical protein